MVAITSKVDICNLALGLLGQYGTVTNIDTPVSDKEIIFAQWYDISRKVLLKQEIPNFALGRKMIGRLNYTPPFGYQYAYEYPNDCLKILGINDIDLKDKEYSVEENRLLTDYDYEDGLPLRYIKNISDVNSMSEEFKMLLAQYLSGKVAMGVTQSAEKTKAVRDSLPMEMASVSAINAQENPPIRITRSRFRAARSVNVSRNPVKR